MPQAQSVNSQKSMILAFSAFSQAPAKIHFSRVFRQARGLYKGLFSSSNLDEKNEPLQSPLAYQKTREKQILVGVPTNKGFRTPSWSGLEPKIIFLSCFDILEGFIKAHIFRLNQMKKISLHRALQPIKKPQKSGFWIESRQTRCIKTLVGRDSNQNLLFSGFLIG